MGENVGKTSKTNSQSSLLQWISRGKSIPPQVTVATNAFTSIVGTSFTDEIEVINNSEEQVEDETTHPDDSDQLESHRDRGTDTCASSQEHECSKMNMENFKHWKCKKQHFIRCEVCFQNLNTVKLFVRNKLPDIVKECGAVYRSRTLENHVQTKYHKEAMKSERIKKLPVEKLYQETPIGSHISTANEELANKLGKLFLHVYNDAKKLTLSAYSWPSRVVASEMANLFSFNHPENNIKIDFQYVNPASHRELLEIIVRSHKKTLSEHVKQAIASSLRCDGSVDRTQVDKLFVMLKIINDSAEEELVFVGAKEPNERGAEGLLNAVKAACKETGGESPPRSVNAEAGEPDISKQSNDTLEFVLHQSSSIVTDGTNVNSGEKAGLWTLLEKVRTEECPSDQPVPLLKIWCAVHRSQLAWKNVTENVAELKLLIQELKSISTYFHTSGVRTRERKETGEEHKLTVKRYPEYFQIRFTEFLYELIDSHLASWNATVLYFKKHLTDPEGCGYLKEMTDEVKLRLTCFVGDVLAVYKRYQKMIQSDSLTLLDLEKETASVKAQLRLLLEKHLVGGWEDALLSGLSENGTVGLSLKGIVLNSQRPRRVHHLFVTPQRDLAAIKNEVVLTLEEYLNQRFSIDEEVLKVLKPFTELKSDTDIKKVHQTVCADLDLMELAMEFSSLVTWQELNNLKKLNLPQLVQHLCRNQHMFPNLITAFARVWAAKPHSCDVERLISACNLLKTSTRNRINIETQNLYLYIHFNMPTLEEWDPRPCIVKWLRERDHRKKTTEKACVQRWFKGVFKEASCENEEPGDTQETREQQKKKAKLF